MSTLKVNEIQTTGNKTILSSTGSILQVVSASDTTRTNITQSTVYSWSALAITITRRQTSSKLWCVGSFYVSSTGGDWDGYLNSSLDGIIIRGDASGSRARGHWSTGTDNAQYSSYATPSHSVNYLYTPSNTTATITITPQLDPEGSNSTTWKLQKDGWDGGDEQAHTLVSTFTVIEVSA